MFNFIALAIIADFDNYVFRSMKNESMKKLTEEELFTEVFVIHHTSSKKCPPSEESKICYHDGEEGFDRNNLDKKRPLGIKF